jgi:hypothetical protein
VSSLATFSRSVYVLSFGMVEQFAISPPGEAGNTVEQAPTYWSDRMHWACCNIQKTTYLIFTTKLKLFTHLTLCISMHQCVGFLWSLTVAMETTANATMEVKRTKRASCSLIPIRIVQCLPRDPGAVGRLSGSIAFCPWIPSPFPSSAQVESLGAIFATAAVLCALHYGFPRCLISSSHTW